MERIIQVQSFSIQSLYPWTKLTRRNERHLIIRLCTYIITLALNTWKLLKALYIGSLTGNSNYCTFLNSLGSNLQTQTNDASLTLACCQHPLLPIVWHSFYTCVGWGNTCTCKEPEIEIRYLVNEVDYVDLIIFSMILFDVPEFHLFDSR